MLNNENAVKRLTFIKYLYNIGLEQSKAPEPMSSVSVLTFHDAVELFFVLSSEYLNSGKKEVKFMEYWELFSPKLKDKELTQKESMRRLNQARVDLKHYGNLPSLLDIERYRATTTNFFEENTQIVFGIKFSDISMVELVQFHDTKENLKESEDLLKKNSIEEALSKVAIAFAQMIDEYEKSKEEIYGKSPFFFGESLAFHKSFFKSIGLGSCPESEKKIAEYIDVVRDTVESMQEGMKILSLGVSYRKYAKFRLLTPHVYFDTKKGYLTTKKQKKEEEIHTKQDVEFCIKFVIESSIKLQEFDYKIEG